LVTFFADDTTVYLSEHDSFSDLSTILSTWCIVSGARFNVTKTEVILIGLPSYHTSIATMRFLQPKRPSYMPVKIPANTHIAADNKAVRLFGAHIGNCITPFIVWGPRIDKIREGLHCWSRCKPTLDGKCLIVYMIVGGMSQYHTRVMGMSAHIEKTLT
ncbi:uncharacterized protein PHACADRAFT_91069, partial [Phanerochaete carnosa HHB-10118-sp]